MVGSTGITGAAPIWHDFMEQAFQTLNLPNVPFTQPPGVHSGTQCKLADVNYFATSYMRPTENGTPLYTSARDPYCTVPSVNGLDSPTSPGFNTQPQQSPPQQPQQPQPPQQPVSPPSQPVQPPIIQQQPAQLPSLLERPAACPPGWDWIAVARPRRLTRRYCCGKPTCM